MRPLARQSVRSSLHRSRNKSSAQVAGGIQYEEENDPMYWHTGIDIYLGSCFQGHGAGSEAVGLLARFLYEHRGHHPAHDRPGGR
jgi:hypothetical protein